MPDPQTSAIVAGITAGRLASVIEGWLWEFDDPSNWPNAEDVEQVMQALGERPDVDTEPVRSAIGKCREYIMALEGR